MENFVVEENGIFLRDESGKILAKVEFKKIDDTTYNIYSTFVDDSLRGQKVASKLMQMAYDELVNNRKAKIKATCSYAAHWLEKNNK